MDSKCLNRLNLLEPTKSFQTIPTAERSGLCQFCPRFDPKASPFPNVKRSGTAVQAIQATVLVLGADQKRLDKGLPKDVIDLGADIKLTFIRR